MCRLFGLHAGTNVVAATFWLLEAPDNLAEQSRRNPDGSGLGVFDGQGRPQLNKEPIAAWRDIEFATEAHDLTGTTFVAHVRYATSGSHSTVITHPFLQDDRIFAHNGIVDGLDVLDARLRELGVAELVVGQTDSERVFALITATIRAHRGDITTGLVEAMRWLADNVPLYAVNILLSTATDLWALRYPESHQLYLSDRRHVGGEPRFHMRTNRIRAESDTLRRKPSVVFATEPMDDAGRWELLEPGELIHVDADLAIHRDLLLPEQPRHLLREDELSPAARASLHATTR